MDTPVKLKPSAIIAHLRHDFSERLSQRGVTWNQTGVLQVFDTAVEATAFWYADLKLEERPTVETPHG